mgnify:CR=1 FL=1
MISVNSRDDQLHDVVEPLLAAHHHDQLDAQLKEASAGVTIISAVALKRNENKGRGIFAKFLANKSNFAL